ncbi:hypothetical protein SAMN04487928_11572 [Butyrivibrio proteoclasticus]|uniref:Peptidase C39 family n=1 Tax=Butyrivibrio proteoclasticus TaxID=43305 RepID=A0A1I5V370_9FIRM|nr:hypothetical protein [Butyrivibrio proteoclasticus]SFQ01963.1 hypothetical protein SAMN04487928_11572 [Butyrivibrio proteoclasticus]
MRDNLIKITIIKTIYAIAIFVIAVFALSKLSNGDNADMTARMQPATLPVVTLVTDEGDVNPLHGYLSDIDVNYMRGTVFPVGGDRSFSFKINTFGSNVWNIGFELRSIDGNRLIENTPITDYAEDNDYITGNIQLKDLITADTEYMLVFVMETDNGTVRYYTRVVWEESGSKYNLDECLSFVLGFSEATFSKTEAKEYSKYLESNSEGDNTSFNKVNIHSSFSQVTWGELNITKHTTPEVYITDIHSQTACIELQYRVALKDGNYTRAYNVVEDYRVRYTTDRLYLLNFERTMNFIFDYNSYSVGKNSISLGIEDSDIEFRESASGTAFAFVSENRLYAFNNSENRLAYIFGFYDGDNDDIRTRWNKNLIKILNVDEAGNVKFAVAGYMNRGIHEGEVGIAVYDYNSSLNAVEEQIFVKSTSSPEILMSYFDRLAYSSNNEMFYCMLDQNVYEIDLIGKSGKSVVDDIGTGQYKISESQNVIAWQKDDLKSLQLMNLNTRATSEITADEGDFIILLGFMGEDLVYGLVHEQDVMNDQMGNPIYAMYCLKIEDSDGNLLEKYSPEGIYITGVTVNGNQLKITRVVKNEDGSGYVSTYDDQIMNTLEVESGNNTVDVASVDVFEKIVQITTKSEIKSKQLRVLTPNQTLFEGDRDVEIKIERDIDKNPLYYVYGLNGDVRIYASPAKAVLDANDAPGVVTSDNNEYIWIKGNLLRSNQIMAITRMAESYENMTSQNPVAVCLDLVLQFRGTNRDVEGLLANGMGVEQILENSLTDARVLDLDGCPLSSMLYYVNQDIPVICLLNNGDAMLVIGFNELNTVLMDPMNGAVYKYGMNDSAELFENDGNHFITYITEG